LSAIAGLSCLVTEHVRVKRLIVTSTLTDYQNMKTKLNNNSNHNA